MSQKDWSWKEKQHSWLKQRHLDFPPSNKKESDASDSDTVVVDDTFVGPDYQLVRVLIKDNQFIFDTLGMGTLNLYRNTTYIFDLSHPSNQGHHLMISRNPSSGSVRDLGIQGTSGKPGALIPFL